MSVATELVPEVYIPERARATQARCPGASTRPEASRPAQVVRLYAPPPAAVSAPLRLTHRGVVVLCALVGAVAAALVALAAASAPGGPAVTAGSGPATVVVHPGDTLWSIASRVDPGVDPRLEVADLQRRNHLVDTALRPGQVLRVR